MPHTWIEEYLLLCMRLDATLSSMGTGPFVDSYFGPPTVKAQAQAEKPLPLAAHIEASHILLERLPAQDFEPERTVFLEKQLVSAETIARICAGEAIDLERRLRDALDIQLAARPDSDLMEALNLIDRALPGKGEVRERFAAWQERNVLPPEKARLAVSLMEKALNEARRRTQLLVGLPEGEALDLVTLEQAPYGAANWYQGGYRSRLELNVNRPVVLSGLLYQMCHEAYPGHHTEYTLKEARLYRALGREETCLYTLGPQTVISEGIASLGFEVIFSPEEAAEWLVESLYTPLGILVEGIDLPGLIRAMSLGRPDDLSSNIRLRMEQGQPEDELVEFAMRITLQPEALVRSAIQRLRDPLQGIYCFAYYGGVRLIEPSLKGPEGKAAFRRVLTEQIVPSALA